MSSRAGRIGVVAGVLAVVGTGCLDSNPKFLEPTDGATSLPGSTGSDPTRPTTVEPPTTAEPTTTPPPTTTGETTATTDGMTVTGSSTTMPPPSCGDGTVDDGEECDEGPNNSDTGTCTSACTLPACGDGFVQMGEECDDGNLSDTDDCTSMCKKAVCGDGFQQAGFEECDDGNAVNEDECTSMCKPAKCGDGFAQSGVEECDDKNDVPTDLCHACAVPRSCADLLELVKIQPALLSDGIYEIDVDGPMGVAPKLPAKCDMTSAGGGWTVIERSPRSMPIGKPLFELIMINEDPSKTPYRMPTPVIGLLRMTANEARIDCGKGDYLLFDEASLDLGLGQMPGCSVGGKVLYKEAQLKGIKLANKELCTGVYGMPLMCEGTWRIDQSGQGECGLQNDPWGQGKVTPGADLFAVDAKIPDSANPVHDCHLFDAVREIKLR